MKNKFFNRITSLICAMVTMFNTFIPILGNTTYAATELTNDFIGSRILLVDKNSCGRYLTYNGEEIQAKYVVYASEDGNEYPAYCNEPSFQGVGSNGIHFGEYVVKSKVTDDRLWRVATNGFPYKTPSEMGANGEREAFFATKQAIYRTLDDEPISNYGSLNSEGENMIEAIQELYDIGLNGDGEYIEPELTITPESTETILDENDPNYKSQIFTVEGNCEFEEYEVVYEIADLPLGTKITSEDGIEKTTFDSEEKFKVMIPVGENETTAFEIKVKASLKSMPVYLAECDNVRMQTMLVTASPYEEVITDVAVKLNKLTTDIIIEKRDSITNEGLGNATFEVTKVDGQIVGTYVTDENGEVVVKVTESGYYKILETIPPENYLLSENNEQIINVQFNTENKAVFLNDRKSGIEILKLDKTTNKPLEGAKYRVTKADGTLIGDYVTNKSGIINIQDLEPNSYQVEELESPLNYLLNTTVYNVNVVENEVTEVVLYNKPLTGIQIIKRDSLTEKPLANATFEVTMLSSNFAPMNTGAYEGGWYIGDFTTDESGTINIPNLYPGIYRYKRKNGTTWIQH